MLVCFLLRLKRDKNVSHLQAISSIWRPLSPWGPLDFLSTYLGNDSLTTMLLCPWNFPGKNTGVGCHFLLQCMKVKSDCEVTQPCPTLRDPMNYGPPGSSVHVRESFPRQVDRKSRGPQGERGLEFSRRKKGQTFQSVDQDLGTGVDENEGITVRKSRVLQMEEIACKCQTFLSLKSGRRKQTSNIFFLLYTNLKGGFS